MCHKYEGAFPIEIWKCEHGTYHLAVGNLTLRLSGQQLNSLTDFLVSAQVKEGLVAERDRRYREGPIWGAN